MNKDNSNIKILLLGSFYASLSAILGGSTFVFTRYVVDSIDPFTLSFVRYGLTGLILFLITISAFIKKKFDKTDLLPMSFLGLSMITLFPNFMALGSRVYYCRKGWITLCNNALVHNYNSILL